VATALVTGASSGIGRASALRLARSGWTVLAGVRDGGVGEQLAAEASAGRILPLELDVTDPGQIAAAAARVEDGVSDGARTVAPGRLDALVNNAGIGLGGPLEIIAPEDWRRQFDVNVFGQVAVTRALLPALRRAGGRIVFVSSIGGFISMPFASPYGASKHAIEAIADSLRVELASSRVKVVLVEPGSVSTAIWDKTRAETASLEVPAGLDPVYGKALAAAEKAIEDTARRGMPPDVVAGVIERALSSRRVRARYVVGRDARMMLALKRVLPDLAFDRLLRRALGV
jgi:NAD(P)-dependent dehydrogenase (short-subunit alcohol dehydrogenase family)